MCDLGIPLTAFCCKMGNKEAMRAARAEAADPGGLASDGQDNLVGPCDAGWRALLAFQLGAADLALSRLAEALAGACGLAACDLRGAVFVQQAELCRDLDVPEAERAAEELLLRPLPGAAVRRARREPSVAGGPVCVSWSAGARRSPVMKVYPKRRDLLRSEVCLRSREAVLAFHRREGAACPGRCPLSGGLGDLLADLAAGAAPFLDRAGLLAAEATEVLDEVGLASGPCIDAILRPLLSAATAKLAVPSAPGRRPSAKAAAEAQRAVRGLIAEGSFDAAGMATSSAALRALRAMEAAGDLRTDRSRPRLFCLAARHEAARRAAAIEGYSPIIAPLGPRSQDEREDWDLEPPAIVVRGH